jgi:hypothetical protein
MVAAQRRESAMEIEDWEAGARLAKRAQTMINNGQSVSIVFHGLLGEQDIEAIELSEPAAVATVRTRDGTEIHVATRVIVAVRRLG